MAVGGGEEEGRRWICVEKLCNIIHGSQEVDSHSDIGGGRRSIPIHLIIFANHMYVNED